MKHTKLFVTSLAGLLLSLSCVHASGVLPDDLSSGLAGVNGTAYDIRPGSETWISASQTTTPPFRTDGAFARRITSSTGGTATQAFTPRQGKICTLAASLLFTVGGSDSWLGLGFAKCQNTNSGANNRISSPPGNVICRAWTYFRDNTNDPQAAMDDTTSAVNWTALCPAAGGPAAARDMRVMLDTTAGAANRTAKNTAFSTDIKIRDTAGLLTEDIDSISFAVPGKDMSGMVSNFSSTRVREPTAALLGMLGLLRRRH